MRLVFIMWVVYTIQMLVGDLGFLGIEPRTLSGLKGILFAPLIHGSTNHIISNSIPILMLGYTLYLFYNRIAPRVFLIGYFFTNILVWIVGRPSYHIGASGLVYALAGFLISYGFFKRNFKSLLISIVIISFYGGIIYGIFPTRGFISWESHLAGFLVGIGMAYGFAKANAEDKS
mgnify:CR=1 FL=1